MTDSNTTPFDGPAAQAAADSLTEHFSVVPHHDDERDLAVMISVSTLQPGEHLQTEIQSVWRHLIYVTRMDEPDSVDRYLELPSGIPTVHITDTGVSLENHVVRGELLEGQKVPMKWRAAAIRRGYVVWALCAPPVTSPYSGDLVEYLAQCEERGQAGYTRCQVKATDAAVEQVTTALETYKATPVPVDDGPGAPGWWAGSLRRRQARTATHFGMSPDGIRNTYDGYRE